GPHPGIRPLAVAAWERLQVYRRQAEEEERGLNQLLSAPCGVSGSLNPRLSSESGVSGSASEISNLESEIAGPEPGAGSAQEPSLHESGASHSSPGVSESSLHGGITDGRGDHTSSLQNDGPSGEDKAGRGPATAALGTTDAKNSSFPNPEPRPPNPALQDCSFPNPEPRNSGPALQDASCPTPDSRLLTAAVLVAGMLTLYDVPAALVFAAAEHRARLQGRLYRWCCRRYGRLPDFDKLRPDSCWTNPRQRDALREGLLRTPPNRDWGLHVREARRNKAANGENREP
ncbi:MAG TPA: hypothetical protein VGW33_02895, partial [Terriglobia bacterium]|nr:hypothetical protein [Terriglobia bacterium]